MNSSLAKALVFAAVVTALLAWLHRHGLPPWALLGGIAIALGVAVLAWKGSQWLGDAFEASRRWRWRKEEGHFHAFGGVALRIDDDGRHSWIDGRGLQQVLATRDAEDVLAARHAGKWKRDERGTLWLRVDDVVERLATMPGRAEPRTVRLRRYLEREVLFPAARRRERGGR